MRVLCVRAQRLAAIASRAADARPRRCQRSDTCDRLRALAGHVWTISVWNHHRRAQMPRGVVSPVATQASAGSNKLGVCCDRVSREFCPSSGSGPRATAGAWGRRQFVDHFSATVGQLRNSPRSPMVTLSGRVSRVTLCSLPYLVSPGTPSSYVGRAGGRAIGRTVSRSVPW